MITEGTLLLIEDSSADIYIFKQAAKELGFDNKVSIVNSGNEALEFIRNHGPQLFMILCDINMPKMTGMELKREIEKTSEMYRKSIPFVFLTTSKSDQELEDAYELRAQGYFLKGENYQQYLDTLQIIIKYWDICEHPRSIKDYNKKGIK